MAWKCGRISFQDPAWFTLEEGENDSALGGYRHGYKIVWEIPSWYRAGFDGGT